MSTDSTKLNLLTATSLLSLVVLGANCFSVCLCNVTL